MQGAAWRNVLGPALGTVGHEPRLAATAIVRTFPKDHILLMQAVPLSVGVPAAHALVHRAALDHLDFASPPAGESWLLHALWLQSLFGSVGRHRRIDTVAFEEVDDVDTNAEEGGSLRARFERTAPARSTRTA